MNNAHNMSKHTTIHKVDPTAIERRKKFIIGFSGGKVRTFYAQTKRRAFPRLYSKQERFILEY